MRVKVRLLGMSTSKILEVDESCVHFEELILCAAEHLLGEEQMDGFQASEHSLARDGLYLVEALEEVRSDKEYVLIKCPPEKFMTHYKGAIFYHVKNAYSLRDVSQLQNFLVRGHDINYKAKRGVTALHWACRQPWVAIPELLLENGAMVDAGDATGCTPLYNAAWRGYSNVTKLLVVGHQANVHAKNNCTGSTPLHMACSLFSDKRLKYGNERLLSKAYEEIVTCLIASGANVNASDNDGQTPLYRAVDAGYANLSQLLVNAGADANSPNREGITPLFLALELGDLEIAEVLVKGGTSMDSRDSCGETPLHKACFDSASDEMVKLMIQNGAQVNARDAQGRTPFIAAFEQGNVRAMKLLVESGAEYVNFRIGNQGTPLHVALSQLNFRLIDYNLFAEVVGLFVRHGADINAKDDSDQTIFGLACLWQHEGLVNLFLMNGADINCKDEKERTPLHLLCSRGQQFAKVLIRKGADTHARDDHGDMPLHVCHDRTIIEELLAHGADANARGYMGRRPLHHMSLTGNLQVVEALIENGADVNPESLCDFMPIHAACSSTSDHSVRVIRLLVNNGARVNAKTSDGETGLYMASGMGNLGVVEALISLGADPAISADNGLGPLHTASINNRYDVVMFLLKHCPSMLEA